MNDNLPSTAYGVMRLLPGSKREVEVFSNQLITAVQNGEVNPLQLKAFFKSMEAVIEKVDEATKVNLLNEADRYPGDKFEAYGFEIQKGVNGVKYDYLTCGDPIYEQLDSSMKSLKTQLSEREAFLRTIKEPLLLVDTESGEQATVKPPQKKGTPGLKFFLK